MLYRSECWQKNRMTVTSGEVSGEDIDVTHLRRHHGPPVRFVRAAVYPRPNTRAGNYSVPRYGNHFISPGPHIFDMFCGERAGITPAPTRGMAEWLLM